MILMRGQAVRIPYNQMVIGLDRLMFHLPIENQQQAEDRAATIDAYLEACGYSWDDLIGGVLEETNSVPARTNN
jgi:hypothetical protein